MIMLKYLRKSFEMSIINYASQIEGVPREEDTKEKKDYTKMSIEDLIIELGDEGKVDGSDLPEFKELQKKLSKKKIEAAKAFKENVDQNRTETKEYLEQMRTGLFDTLKETLEKGMSMFNKADFEIFKRILSEIKPNIKLPSYTLIKETIQSLKGGKSFSLSLENENEIYMYGPKDAIGQGQPAGYIIDGKITKTSTVFSVGDNLSNNNIINEDYIEKILNKKNDKKIEQNNNHVDLISNSDKVGLTLDQYKKAVNYYNGIGKAIIPMIDGKSTEITDELIKKVVQFQKENGLQVDGIFQGQVKNKLAQINSTRLPANQLTLAGINKINDGLRIAQNNPLIKNPSINNPEDPKEVKETAGEEFKVIKKGNTLYGLFGKNYKQIIQYNKEHHNVTINPRKIKIGQKIYVPKGFEKK